MGGEGGGVNDIHGKYLPPNYLTGKTLSSPLSRNFI